MRLNVLPTPDRPWYADGLHFTCAQCGNCCTGGPGYVWISTVEIERLATHLKLSVEQTLDRHCRKIGDQYSLKETRTRSGLYDCAFLEKVDGKSLCTIYPVRPLQCRTWPFWDGNLASQDAWNHAAVKCHGMNRGRTFPLTQIHSLRDSKDWPKSPPTSGKP